MVGKKLSQAPSVDKVVRSMKAAGLNQRAMTHAARLAVAAFRVSVQPMSFEAVVRLADSYATGKSANPSPLVINMSGVVLHTGLGRARLSGVDSEVWESLRGHSAVEFDLGTGNRGDRQDLIRPLLKELTGAQDALVVNNCAGALFLTLIALCKDREVVLSRGQMVEIGGSFRMPDIVQEAGCTLVGVGCTNKTRIDDYASQLNDRTGAILRCHPSNFKVVGFTEEPTAKEISELAHSHGTIMIDDVGHGCLLDTSRYGLPKERTLQEALQDGADIVLASGDKLLGGPQAGLILGKEELVQKIARHPLARALRADKICLTLLAATLRAYLKGREDTLPLWKCLLKPVSQLKVEAKKLATAYPGLAVVEPGETQVGGGAMPVTAIETFRAGLKSKNPDELALRLRKLPVPIIGRIEKGFVWLDPRTTEEDEIKVACSELRTVAIP